MFRFLVQALLEFLIWRSVEPLWPRAMSKNRFDDPVYKRKNRFDDPIYKREP
jgi:hypothetical protein